MTQPAPAPPHPPLWRGHFFPNQCLDSVSRFHQMADLYPVEVRHLPAAAAIAEVLEAFGERARPLLEEWHALWAGAVGDVDEYARLGPHLGRDTGEADWNRHHRERAYRMLAHGKVAQAARDLYRTLATPQGRVRSRAHHILEDAAIHTALAASRVPFALVVGSEHSDVFMRPRDGSPGLEPRLDAVPQDIKEMVWAARLPDNPYWIVPAFRAMAGRPMAVTRDLANLVMALLDMALQGHAKAFLKAVNSKTGTWVVDLQDVATVDAAQDRLMAALGPHGSVIAGAHSRSPSATWMQVQAFTPFVAEHRFFVVDHRVVASTASDRALSVLDAHPARILHPAVARLHRPAATSGAYDRGSADTVADRALVARMARQARALARAFKEHAATFEGDEDAPGLRGHTCYVIDMGLTEDGRVLPIETNGIPYAGLYALPYRRVARALERHYGRMGPAPALGRSARRDHLGHMDDAPIEPLLAPQERRDVAARAAALYLAQPSPVKALEFTHVLKGKVERRLRRIPRFEHLDGPNALDGEIDGMRFLDEPGMAWLWEHWLRDHCQGIVERTEVRLIRELSRKASPQAEHMIPVMIRPPFGTQDPGLLDRVPLGLEWSHDWLRSDGDMGYESILAQASFDQVDWPGTILRRVQGTIADKVARPQGTIPTLNLPVVLSPGASVVLSGGAPGTPLEGLAGRCLRVDGEGPLIGGSAPIMPRDAPPAPTALDDLLELA